jgi:DUF1680 family protein
MTVISTPGAATRSLPVPVLRPLGYTGNVRITSGPLAERIDDAVETYLGVEPDDILHGFRLAADQDAPGKPMTGWSSKTTSPTFGQWMSGLARIGVTAGRPEATERALALAKGWAATIHADGNPGLQDAYGLEKVVCALVDLTVLADRPDLLDLVAKVTEWADTHWPRDRPVGTPVDFEGGMYAGPGETLEWYTIAENFYRGWLAGGDDALKEFAAEWHYDHFWDRFLEKPAPGQPWVVPTYLHAYSHLNTFSSAAAAYEVTGDERFLTILKNAHDYFTTTQNYATGGYGPSEFTMPEDGSLGRSVEWRTDTAEIVCGSWAAFKLTSALLKHTGEARYADWVEQLVYSGIGAVTPVQPSGKTPYYQDYRLGIATKLPHWDDWPCCSGTYIQCVSHLPDLVYFAADDGLAVTLYVPSTVEWEHEGQTRSLTQETGFPAADTSTLTIGGAGRFTLKLRVPAWTEGFSVAVNGEALGGEATPSDWFVIDRDWADGDTVVVTLGAGLRLLPIDRWHPNRVAVAYGPVVLGQSAEWTAPLALQIPWAMIDLNAAFSRDDEGLHFTPNYTGTARLKVGSFKPLSEFPDRFPHRVYFDVDAPRIV